MRRNADLQPGRARRRAPSILTLLATVLAAGVVAAPARAAAPDPATTCRGDSPAAEAMVPTVEPIVLPWLGEQPTKQTNMPGLAIGVVIPVPGQPGASQTALISCGVTEVDGTDPVGPRTRYEIGSESKLFTALAFADRILAGTIGIDDTVQQHLPASSVVPEHPCGSPATTPMSLRDLATHNSGLRKDPKNITWFPDHDMEGHSRYDRTLLHDSFASGWSEPCDALFFDPGAEYRYSNWGFALLGTILADQYHPGQVTPPYRELVDELVIDPLGLTSTEIQPTSPLTDFAAPTCKPNADAPCHWNNDNAFAGAGGLISDITDMSSFVRANLGFDPTISLGPAIRLTQEPAGIGSACDSCMGLGWEITPPDSALSPLRVLAKDGGTWGSHSQTYLVPDGCWGITLLSNANQPTPVGDGGVGGDLVKALGPKTATGPCAAAIPATTSTSTPTGSTVPMATPAVAVGTDPRLAG